MVLSMGFYRIQHTSFLLVRDPSDPGFVIVTTSPPSTPAKFRKDKAGWLSVDDGQTASQIFLAAEQI
jgi:hypothetical protein